MSEDEGDEMSTDMDESSEESSSDGELDEEGESDAVTATALGAEAEQYDENMDFAEEEEALRKRKGE